MSNRVLILGDYKYGFDDVVKLGASGPIINVDENDNNPSDESQENEDYRVMFDSDALAKEASEKYVLFYKQNGKYTVLLGNNKLDETKTGAKYKGVLTGKLISTPAIKKARIEAINQKQ